MYCLRVNPRFHLIYKSAEYCQCHINCSCQAECQGSWTSCLVFLNIWDPMGAKISKRYSSCKLQSKAFKLFLNFFPTVLTKLRLGFLKIEILTIFFFSFSLTWDPMGAKISKRYSYKLQLKVFKLLLNFFPNGPHKTTLGIFKILKIKI